jgi:hypothetical protein
MSDEIVNPFALLARIIQGCTSKQCIDAMRTLKGSEADRWFYTLSGAIGAWRLDGNEKFAVVAEEVSDWIEKF